MSLLIHVLRSVVVYSLGFINVEKFRRSSSQDMKPLLQVNIYIDLLVFHMQLPDVFFKFSSLIRVSVSFQVGKNMTTKDVHWERSWRNCRT